MIQQEIPRSLRNFNLCTAVSEPLPDFVPRPHALSLSVRRMNPAEVVVLLTPRVYLPVVHAYEYHPGDVTNPR